MSCIGVHFALSEDQETHLLAAFGNDQAVLEIVEAIEDIWDENFLVKSDLAWNAIHRCFCDGDLLYLGGEYPLNHVICGGKQLIVSEESDYTVSYVSRSKVRDVTRALGKINREEMQQRYMQINENNYEHLISDEDFNYMWIRFCNVAKLFNIACKTSRAVIFTVNC